MMFDLGSVWKKISNTYLTKDFMLFIFCGGMGTLTNFLFSLLISIRVNATLSYVLGFAISLSIAYTLNSWLIFKERCKVDRFIKFVISYIPNFMVLFTFVIIFLNVFLWNKVLVYGLAGLIGLPLTYLLVKTFAFGNKDD